MTDTTKKKKNYIRGSAREKVFNNGGRVINIDLNVSELAAIANDKGYAKITISELREPDMYGNTYSIYENEFVPTKQTGASTKPTAKPATKPAGKKSYDEDSGLPF